MFWGVAIFLWFSLNKSLTLETWLPSLLELQGLHPNPRGIWKDDRCLAPPLHNFSSPRLPPLQANSTSSKVAFLFLTNNDRDGPVLEEMWRKWLPEDDPRYLLLVHTEVSTTTVPLGPFFCRHAIPSVPSKHTFLLQAEMQLLKYALNEGATHFVFLSLSHMPIRSFDSVYEQLVKRTKNGSRSIFWISDQWQVERDWSTTSRELGIARQHLSRASQWSVLTRFHVQVILRNELTLLRWNHAIETAYNEGKRMGPPDELFFPTLLKQQLYTNFSSAVYDDYHLVWMEWIAERNRDCSPHHGRPPEHPCTFQSLKLKLIRYLQGEGYLFVRKILPNTQLVNPDENREPLLSSLPRVINGYENAVKSISESIKKSTAAQE